MLDSPETIVDANSAQLAPKIGIVIVDDHTMVADGFARIVSSEIDFKLAGIASSVAEAMALIERETPDVVLMDYHLPDGDGGQATEAILLRWPETKVLMLSGTGGNELLARSIEAGCSGFLMKTRPAVDVVAAIRSAARGELVIRPDELAGLLDSVRDGSTDDGLTNREIEVLRLLAKGHSTDDIASELYLSVHTVRNHVRNILMKLHAHSKLAAVAVAVRDGIIGLDEIG